MTWTAVSFLNFISFSMLFFILPVPLLYSLLSSVCPVFLIIWLWLSLLSQRFSFEGNELRSLTNFHSLWRHRHACGLLWAYVLTVLCDVYIYLDSHSRKKRMLCPLYFFLSMRGKYFALWRLYTCIIHKRMWKRALWLHTTSIKS